MSSHGRYAYASDHKTLYFACFLYVFFTYKIEIAQNGLQPHIEYGVKPHEIHSFFVQILIHFHYIQSQLFIRFDTLFDAL